MAAVSSSALPAGSIDPPVDPMGSIRAQARQRHRKGFAHGKASGTPTTATSTTAGC
jgi:hypothetical protein